MSSYHRERSRFELQGILNRLISFTNWRKASGVLRYSAELWAHIEFQHLIFQLIYWMILLMRLNVSNTSVEMLPISTNCCLGILKLEPTSHITLSVILANMRRILILIIKVDISFFINSSLINFVIFSCCTAVVHEIGKFRSLAWECSAWLKHLSNINGASHHTHPGCCYVSFYARWSSLVFELSFDWRSLLLLIIPALASWALILKSRGLNSRFLFLSLKPFLPVSAWREDLIGTHVWVKVCNVMNRKVCGLIHSSHLRGLRAHITWLHSCA